MKLSTILKNAVPLGVAVIGVGLVFRYLGDYPIIEDAKKGLNGDTVGWFK